MSDRKPMTPGQVRMENPSPDDLEAAGAFYDRLVVDALKVPPGVRYITKCDECGDDLALLPEHKQGDRYVCPLCRLITKLRPETT